MRIYYDLTENADPEFLFCDTCGTYFSDSAEMDTDKRTVTITVPGCTGEIVEELSYQEFLDEFEGNHFRWPDEPFNTLINDLKDLVNK